MCLATVLSHYVEAIVQPVDILVTTCWCIPTSDFRLLTSAPDFRLPTSAPDFRLLTSAPDFRLLLFRFLLHSSSLAHARKDHTSDPRI